MRAATLLSTFLCLAGCTTYDPLYCDDQQSCKDPDRPFCDLAGEYPASDGVARTCIPSPFDAGSPDGGGAGADGGGGRVDAGPTSDAAIACSWSRPSRLANINGPGSEYPGSFSSDLLSLYFSRSINAPDPGIYVATRETLGQAFGVPELIEELSNDDVTEADPEISPSGLEIFYRIINGNDIQTATRGSPTGIFGPSQPIGLAGITPSLSADGLALYFVGSPGSTVQRVTRGAVGQPWGKPTTVLPTGGYLSVDVSGDELRLLITLSPFEQPEIPLAISTRNSTDEAFGPPVLFDQEFLVPNGTTYTYARWDESATRMVVSVIVDGETGLYYSACQ